MERVVLIALNVLIVVNVEIIHFLQYAILAILLFQVLGSYFATFWWGTVLGFIDELYQYIILSPNSDYFDFNDVFLDQIGLLLGMIMLYLYKQREKTETVFLARTSALVGLTLSLAVGLLAMYYNGSISVMPSEGATFEMIHKHIPGFWRTIPPNETFHVMGPLEGIITIGLMFLIIKPLRYN